MRKITRKQAVSNMQCLFDDFFKTYFRAPKEAIDETLDNTRFYEQKEKLKKAVYSAEYSSILGQLDSESFRKYYEKVGEFAKAYKIDMRLFTEETPALIEDINDVLKESPNIAEKLDLINGFTDEELKTDRISFGTKTALIESILDCWFVGDDKEQGINRMLMSLTAEDRLAFVNKIGTDRKFLNRLIQCVNGREKDEMLAVLGEIFISTGLANEGTGTAIDNGQSDKIEASYNNGSVSIAVLQEQGMGARDYRMTPKARYTVNALENISMYYDGRLINVPALLLLNSWSNDMAEPEGLFYNYRHEDIDWNKLSDTEKDEYFTDFVKHYMGEALFNELAGNPLGLLVITIVGILLAYLAVIPAAIMAIAGAGLAGANIYAGSKMLTSALEQKQKASNMHEYKKAAKLFAESIAKIGVNTLMLIISLIQTGKAVFKGKVVNLNKKQPVKRIEKQAEVKFKIKEKFDVTEYKRQLQNQENGLNKMTIQEYLDNIENYKKNGRGTESVKIQKQIRNIEKAKKISELRKKGFSSEDAEKLAEEWIKTQSALHNPDMNAGGNPLDVTDVGDARINSSIGSQWRNGNTELLETQIRSSIKSIEPKDYTTTYLNVKLKTE